MKCSDIIVLQFGKGEKEKKYTYMDVLIDKNIGAFYYQWQSPPENWYFKILWCFLWEWLWEPYIGYLI